MDSGLIVGKLSALYQARFNRYMEDKGLIPASDQKVWAFLGDGEMDGYQIICPRHGARFDVRTGKVLALPAVENTPAYPVRVREGQIEIGILKSK